MNIKPLSNNVIIEPAKEDKKETKTDAGIIIPDSAKKEEQPTEGKVIAVGPGKLTDKGERTEMSVKVGDKVIFNEGFSPTKFKSEGKEYILVEESNIYGVIKK